MDKASILYIDNSFTFGGAINSLSYLMRALDPSGYRTVLITGQPQSVLKEKMNGFTCYTLKMKLPWVHNAVFRKVISLPVFRNRMLLKTAVGLRFLYWIAVHIVPEAYQYYRIGRKHNVSIVHLNNIFSTQLSGIIASKMLNVPCVAHLRDFESSSFMVRRYAALVDHHVAVSSAVQESLLELGIPREKTSLIHDALDLEEFDTGVPTDYLYREFNVKKSDRLFGIFGRIIEWKGIKEFILAAHRVLREIPDAKAFIVGSTSDGAESYREEMTRLVEELRIEDRVVFTGYRKDVPNLMKWMDVIVHASTRPEPFGMVIIEGMAMGKPVVATRSGGPADIVVDGETGLLVPLRDVGAMAEAVERLLKDPALRKKLGVRGKQRVEQLFTKERYAGETERVYARLLNPFSKA